MLDVSVAMNGDRGPCCEHRRHIGQRRQQRLLVGEARQRLFACRAVFTNAGFLHDPFAQLPIGIRQIAKRAQRHEGLLDVFDARFNDALLLGGVRGTGIDPEAISFSEARVGALDLGVVRACPDDRALRVVDDDSPGAAAEPLEGASVAGQPRLDGLIEHEFDILMTRPA